MVRWIRWLLLTLLAFVVMIAGAVVAIEFMPVSMALGPCLKDWTSPVSYRSRLSPLAALRFGVGEGEVEICYGRPSAHGRTIFGRLVPYGELWRTGANEPTRLFTTVPLSVAGIDIPPGRYSVYTVPGPTDWVVAVNRSRFHWGLDFSAKVLAQEVGRSSVPADSTASFVETLTLRVEPEGGGGQVVGLVLEWERTRVVIPIRAGSRP